MTALPYSFVALYAIALIGVLLAPGIPDPVRVMAENFGRIPLQLLGALAAWRLAYHDQLTQRLRWVWWCLGLGLLLFVAGELATRFKGGMGADGMGWHRYLFLAGYVFFGTALLSLPRLFRGAADIAGNLVDAAVFALAFSMLVWVALRGVPSEQGLLWSFAYPAADTLLLFALATVLQGLPAGSARTVYLWLSAAALALLAGDIATALASGDILPETQIPQVLWSLSPLLFLRAALVQGRHPIASVAIIGAQRHRAGFALALPYLGGALGVTILASLAGPLDIILPTVVMITLILARLALAQRQNQHPAFAAALAEGASRMEAVLERSADAIALLDGRGAVVFANPALERMLGDKVERADRFVDLVTEQDQQRFENILKRARDASPQHTRVHLKGAQGLRVVDAVIGDHGDDGRISGAILNLRDITRQADLEEQLAQQMLHDALTGLPNRALMMDRLTQSLERAKQSTDVMVAVMLIDLDKFKLLNDSHGPRFGDQLLMAVAGRISETVTETATVARVADDEFAVILEDELTVTSVTSIAESLLASFRSDFTMDGQSIGVTISLGIAGPARNGSAEELVRCADVALHQAKANGRNQICAFEAKIDRALESNAAILAGLRRALDERKIEVAFQPIYNIAENHLWGLEVLARWVDPQRGRIAPGVFISAAEDGGLMNELGAQVFERALEHAKAVKRKRPFNLAVNISIQQLADAGFAAMVLERLEKARWSTDQLVFEITESVFAEERRVIKRNLSQLREAGVRIAIDDFGTGYSSLAQLHDFPIDILKIDRRFVNQVEDAAGKETIKAVLAIGRAMDLTIIAEGVESDAQLVALKELNCPLIQGFLFGQPLFSTDLNRMATMVR